MKIEVKLFARARDLAGTSQLSVVLPEKASAGELRRRLAELVPSLAGLLVHSALAIDNELADDATLLSAESEVALLPPVSGG